MKIYKASSVYVSVNFMLNRIQKRLWIVIHMFQTITILFLIRKNRQKLFLIFLNLQIYKQIVKSFRFTPYRL